MKTPAVTPHRDHPLDDDSNTALTTALTTRHLALRHEDTPRNRHGKLHSLPGDALESGVKTDTACVDNDDKLSMGADTQDCPTGSTVRTLRYGGWGNVSLSPCPLS